MISVTENFQTTEIAPNRQPKFKVGIDWRLDGNFTYEDSFILSFGIERTLDEPLAGISSAIADIVLSNKSDRFLSK